MSNQFDDLDFRISDLELAILERQANDAMKKVWPKSKPAVSDDAKGWSLQTSRMSDGSEKHELRNDSGKILPLPTDRASWPKEVREAVAQFEQFDKQRSINGRLTSAACGSVGLRE